MDGIWKGLGRVLAILAIAVPTLASAVTITLGDQDFANNTILTGSFAIPNSGEPAPMGIFSGSDSSAISSFTQSWTFSYASEVATSASITFGIFDHDSLAAGNQLASFSVDGVDLTAGLNGMFEAPGVGEQLEVNVFTLSLAGAALAVLADGSATFTLSLQGPACFGNGGGCGQPSAGATANGAGLDFSTLAINEAQIPEPATLALFGIGLAGLGFSRRKRAAK